MTSSESELVKKSELKAELWKQEHRLFHLLQNLWEGRSQPQGHPLREAATKAFAVRLALSMLPAGVASVTGLIAIGGLWLGWGANDLIEDQNRLVQEQSKLLETQTSLTRQESEFQRLACVAFDSTTHFPVAFSSDMGGWQLEGDESHFPTLVNLGFGPAFDVQVHWQSTEGQNLGKARAAFRHLFPGKNAAVRSIPHIADGEHACRGEVHLEYRTIDGQWHRVSQKFRAHRWDDHDTGESAITIHLDQLTTPPTGVVVDDVEVATTHW